MNEDQTLTALAALSHETRMRMFKALVSAGTDGLTAGEIAQRLKAAPSRASFHLTTLSKAGLITATKQARQITYRVDFQAVGALFAYMLQDCCQNNQTVLSCCGIKVAR